MNSIAENIFETVKTLPEQKAAEVLSFAEGLKAKQEAEDMTLRNRALETLAKFRGRFKVEPFNRDDCYDRPNLR